MDGDGPRMIQMWFVPYHVFYQDENLKFSHGDDYIVITRRDDRLPKTYGTFGVGRADKLLVPEVFKAWMQLITQHHDYWAETA